MSYIVRITWSKMSLLAKIKAIYNFSRSLLLNAKDNRWSGNAKLIEKWKIIDKRI